MLLLPGGLWMVPLISRWALDGSSYFLVGSGWFLLFPGGLWMVPLISRWALDGSSYFPVGSGWFLLFPMHSSHTTTACCRQTYLCPFPPSGTLLHVFEFTVLTCILIHSEVVGHTPRKFRREEISPLFLTARISPATFSPPESPEGTLGYVKWTLAADSTKRRKPPTPL